MHPNEIKLVFLTDAGVALPNNDFTKMAAEARRLGDAHRYAFNAQVSRQIVALKAEAQGA
jgi:hypothetical protein